MPKKPGESPKKRKRKPRLARKPPLLTPYFRGSFSDGSGQNGPGQLSMQPCPKCQGFIEIQMLGLLQPAELRCINCGWQPQWGTRIITESDEARDMRQLSTQLGSDTTRSHKS